MTTSDNDKAYLLDVIAELVAKDDFDGARRLIDSLDESPYAAKEIEAALRDLEVSDSWFSKGDFFDSPSNHTLPLRGRDVTVTEVKEDSKPKRGIYDEAASVVFKLANGQHFRKTGYESSYSGTTWDGSLTEVTPVTQTITIFEEVAR